MGSGTMECVFWLVRSGHPASICGMRPPPGCGNVAPGCGSLPDAGPVRRGPSDGGQAVQGALRGRWGEEALDPPDQCRASLGETNGRDLTHLILFMILWMVILMLMSRTLPVGIYIFSFIAIPISFVTNYILQSFCNPQWTVLYLEMPYTLPAVIFLRTRPWRKTTPARAPSDETP